MEDHSQPTTLKMTPHWYVQMFFRHKPTSLSRFLSQQLVEDPSQSRNQRSGQDQGDADQEDDGAPDGAPSAGALASSRAGSPASRPGGSEAACASHGGSRANSDGEPWG
ncbi:unnamed protein product [Prorocentrum cordatum]|uniref:Uncharacterized protein n=1 Tax=Prorocentrum cordatum TaxID=2364126 RepID=A0ABN9XI03_9DINO|nr:unnamed protein product [Polarella glacialis]